MSATEERPLRVGSDRAGARPGAIHSHTPYVEALRDYAAGRERATLRLRSSLGEDDEVPAAVFFRRPDEFFPFERFALDLARGRVADLGAGTGIHTLALQERGFDVTAIEKLPELVEMQRARGVRRARTADFLSWSGPRFDTVLMLMNGLGPAGSLRGLDRFLRHAHALVEPGGQLLADSGEALPAGPVDPRDADRWPPTPDGYPGEAWIELGYRGRRGRPFRELYVDFETLATRAAAAGWRCDAAFEGEAGSYLARLVPAPGRAPGRPSS